MVILSCSGSMIGIGCSIVGGESAKTANSSDVDVSSEMKFSFSCVGVFGSSLSVLISRDVPWK